MIRLQGKFIGLLLVALGLTSAIVLWGARALIESIEMQMGAGFSKKQVLYDKQRSLRPILKELYLTKRMAESPAIQQWALRQADPTAKARALKALEAYRLESADQSYFLTLTSDQGYYYNDHKTKFSNQPRYFLDPKKQEDHWFFNTLTQNKPCRLNVDYNGRFKVTKVWINCVISVEGIPKGVMGTGFELTTFINQVINDQEQGISNLFIDSSGAIQAHKNQEMIDFNTISKDNGPTKSIFNLISTEKEKEALRQVLFQLKQNPQHAGSLVLKLKNQSYMVGVAYIPEIDWYNISLLQMNSWANMKLFPPAALLLLVIILLVGLGYVLFKGLISDRLARLDAQIIQVSQGDFQITTQKNNGDEIGLLAANVTQMARNLDSRTQELEQLVRDRTAELELANRTKDKFFSIISHDLLGPTGSLSMIFNEVIQEPGDIDEVLFDGLKKTTKSLYELSTQLFEWARSQQGQIKVDAVDVNLNQEVQKMIDLLSGQATRKELTLETTIANDLFVSADSAMLSVVIRNLISNAIKFTSGGGAVKIVARRLNHQVEVSVIDNGVGMTSTEQSQLFRIGEKVKSRLGTDEELGSGLGLILCAEFIKQNQGEIGVKSVLGQGSTFWFVLPLGSNKPENPIKTSY